MGAVRLRRTPSFVDPLHQNNALSICAPITPLCCKGILHSLSEVQKPMQISVYWKE